METKKFLRRRCFPVTKTVVSSRNSFPAEEGEEEEEEEGRCDSQSLMRQDTTIRL